LERNLECECQVLYNERELWKGSLRRQFGVDFDSGGVGLMDWDRNCRTVFGWIAEWNLEFRGQMTGWLDFRVGVGFLVYIFKNTIFNLPQLLTILYIYSIFLDKL
jgi:hypothetical protein